ncbi:MAG: heme ABC transporter permease [Roseibium sp.]|uniref:heme ABC transporter permease n=1 Tax=Roseibium sp. TaxID=1936156 RepID=UPI001B23AFE1|nr:heme ABC transporter permease [Roseibium sp.]MBO6511150.1 heme ABC transporter permease [Roseibium sp.]MBO6892201.1 heme ABC transporter permease [Roseibium sp.]MBO6930194.1 heme ABC transporter permease [Roseibium sp.]
MAFWDYANPTRFLRLVQVLLPWLIGLCLLFFAVGLYMSLFIAPEDYQQGATVRIMYLHVPAAWLCMMCYSVMTLSSIGTLVWKHPLADVSAKSAAPIGAAFTFMALVTGSLWGKPMWGTYWVWDARLTSVLVLLIMYLGLMTLWRTMEDQIKAGKAAAVLTLVGALNLPIIKFSVDWWNTLHQPASVIRMDGPTIHPDLLWPLVIMAIAFTLFFFVIHLMAMRNEILRRRVRNLRMRAAAASHPGTAAATAQPAE